MHFSLSSFKILASKLVYEFVLTKYRTSFTFVSFHILYWELCVASLKFVGADRGHTLTFTLNFFLKVGQTSSSLKVKVTRSKILVPMERSCHKECTYEI